MYIVKKFCPWSAVIMKMARLCRVSPLYSEQTLFGKYFALKRQFFMFWLEQIFQCQELFPLLQDPGDGLLHNTWLLLVLPATAMLGRRDTARKVSASFHISLSMFQICFV